MAGSRPGPAKGSGGRPRTKNPKANAGNGYKRVTVGPPGDGKQVYEHRAKLGIENAGPNVTADHINPKAKGDNRKSNLRVASRSANVARGNRTRKK